MFYIIVLFVLALTSDHPLVAPVADVVIPNIHHIVCLIEMYQVSTLLIDPTPTPPLADVTVQWGPQSTWLDHLAFLDESYNVSAPSTSTFTIPPGQLDPSLGPQCCWLDRLAVLDETYENRDSAQTFSDASARLSECVWLDTLGSLDQWAIPPPTTISLPCPSSPLPHSIWLDHPAYLNICSIGPPPVFTAQPNITTLARALLSAVILLLALLELHGLNHWRKEHANIWLVAIATLAYYAIMLLDVPEQVIFLVAEFVFPLVCSIASWLWRTALLVPTEVPSHKYDALERSHQELMAAFVTLLIINSASYTSYRDDVSAKTISIAELQDSLTHETNRTARLTTEKEAGDADVKTLTNDKSLLTAAVQDLNGQIIKLAQELHATSRRKTEIEGELSVANQLAESQANTVTERNNENATLTARVHTVQQEFSDRLATESATVARLTEEARLAALTQETLVTQKTAAMDRNTALEGQLTEAIQEKATHDTEHANQVQVLTAELQALRASLSTADQRIQKLVLRTTAQAVEISTSRGTMTSLRASLAASQRPSLNLPSSSPFERRQVTHVAPAVTPKPLDSVLQANVMIQGRIKEENRQMQQKIRSLTSEVTGLRMALAKRPAFSFPPAPTPARLDPPAAEPNGQPSGHAVPTNLPSLHEAQHRRRRTLSLTHGTIQPTLTIEEPIDSSRSAQLRDEASHGSDHRRVQTTPTSWSVNIQLEVGQHVAPEKRNGNLAPRIFKVKLPPSNLMTPPTTPIH